MSTKQKWSGGFAKAAAAAAATTTMPTAYRDMETPDVLKKFDSAVRELRVREGRVPRFNETDMYQRPHATLAELTTLLARATDDVARAQASGDMNALDAAKRFRRFVAFQKASEEKQMAREATQAKAAVPVGGADELPVDSIFSSHNSNRLSSDLYNLRHKANPSMTERDKKRPASQQELQSILDAFNAAGGSSSRDLSYKKYLESKLKRTKRMPVSASLHSEQALPVGINVRWSESDDLPATVDAYIDDSLPFNLAEQARMNMQPDATIVMRDNLAVRVHTLTNEQQQQQDAVETHASADHIVTVIAGKLHVVLAAQMPDAMGKRTMVDTNAALLPSAHRMKDGSIVMWLAQHTQQPEVDPNVPSPLAANYRHATFAILVKAASAAGLLDALKGDNLTLFAPTDKAFEDAGITLDNVANVVGLKNVLLNHVYQSDLGPISYPEVKELATRGETIEMLGGASLKLSETSWGAVQVGKALLGDDHYENDKVSIQSIKKVLLPVGASGVSFNESGSAKSSSMSRDMPVMKVEARAKKGATYVLNEGQWLIIPAGRTHTLSLHQGESLVKFASLYIPTSMD